MSRHKKYFRASLASLKAARDHYQEAHWCSCGDSFYGDHLLYERLYESVEEEMDGFAERMIGLYGPECFDGGDHHRMSHRMSDEWRSTQGYAQRSLKVERTIISLINSLKHAHEKAGQMTLGLDDYLPAVASNHEDHLYLIKQRLSRK
jgi:DNA-binding ferritin-like protein